MGRKPGGRSAEIVAEQTAGLDIDLDAANSGGRAGKSSESAEKQKALEAARLQIEKQFGQGSLMKLGAHQSAQGIESIPSGSILLDEALGIGGYPRGRIIEIYGPESSGKTTLALHAIAEAQKKGGIAAFIDAEHALDPVYARNLGVDIDELWVSQPDNGEQALDIAESLIRSGAVDVIVVDSVAALTPQAEIEGEMGDAHVGLQARLMSQALRKLAGTLAKSKTILIFINQIRMKIGIMFGNPETTTGGNALKFYASVRLEVRKIETIETPRSSTRSSTRRAPGSPWATRRWGRAGRTPSSTSNRIPTRPRRWKPSFARRYSRKRRRSRRRLPAARPRPRRRPTRER
ncbi:recombinase RecA, partial [bacterium]|nr:recombinase RecA [bacterium]